MKQHLYPDVEGALYLLQQYLKREEVAVLLLCVIEQGPALSVSVWFVHFDDPAELVAIVEACLLLVGLLWHHFLSS